jgi:hypothetical protein
MKDVVTLRPSVEAGVGGTRKREKEDGNLVPPVHKPLEGLISVTIAYASSDHSVENSRL